jgi:surfactin synthase thioesterase subunit
MDGTGILFDPLLKIISGAIECEVIPLSTFDSHLPSLQAAELAAMIGNEEIILVAESYSGLIAYELCKLKNMSIKHVFFAAGFLERPSLISKYASLLPISFLRWKLIPDLILSYLFFGKPSKAELVYLFHKSLGNVTNRALRTRLNIIAKAKIPSEKIYQPVTYICASNDWLVSNKAMKAFEQLCMNLKVVNVEGGHFIIQSNPERCWHEIRSVLAL